MKTILTLIVATLFWAMPAMADEVETGFFSSSYTFYSGLSQTNNRAKTFATVSSGEFIRGEYLWDKSRIELKQQKLHSKYYGGSGGITLADQTLNQDILNWFYQHSNMEFHMGLRVDLLKSGSGLYVPIAAHSQTRFQWIVMDIRVEENKEYFKIAQDYKLKRVLEVGQTYSESFYKSEIFEIGMYDSSQHEYRISIENLTPVYSNTAPQGELNWLFGFYSHQPEEPSTESYWKGYSIELRSNYTGGKGRYEFDWVNQAVFFLWDLQNIASYGFYVKSHPTAFAEPIANNWNEIAGGGTPTVMHGITLEGTAQISSSPVHIGWQYRYLEIPYISSQVQNDFSINLSAKF